MGRAFWLVYITIYKQESRTSFLCYPPSAKMAGTLGKLLKNDLSIIFRRYSYHYSPQFTAGEAAKTIDLRSDTLTVPTDIMRKAMAEAAVGDDVYGEDPTVKILENKVAALLGKEAGVFVPSGTMANLLAVMTHCHERGSEAFIGEKSHLFLYEQGGMAHLAGVQVNLLPNNDDGTFDLELLKSRVRVDNEHFPRSALICAENSHNACGGKALPLDWLQGLWSMSQDTSIPVHMDGARLLNSAVYQQVPPSKLAEGAKSVSLCLSKGIGAPIGSILASDEKFVQKARRTRKAVGGGMRQVGVLAAAALAALDGAQERIIADHLHAKLLAEGVAAMNSNCVTADSSQLHTNILLLQVLETSAPGFASRLAMVTTEEEKYFGGHQVIIKCLPISPTLVRLVTYGNISSEDVQLALAKIKYVAEEIDGQSD